MKHELFIKEINGDKVYCLEYDKETLKDMVIEKQEEIERLTIKIYKAIEYIKSDEFWLSQVKAEEKLLKILLDNGE